MADLNEVFDAETVDPNVPWELKPKGWYEGMIVESERRQTKAGDGEYLHFTIVHTKEPYQGQKEFLILNLWNPSEKAVQIARGQLSALCRAVGVLKVRDSSELHNLPFQFKLDIEVSGDGVERNKVVAFKSSNGTSVHKMTVQGQQAPASSPAPASSRPPWAKKS